MKSYAYLLLAAALGFAGCSEDPSSTRRTTTTDDDKDDDTATEVTITITPATAELNTGASQTFSATVEGATDKGVTWSVKETDGGTVTAGGTYTAPDAAGTFHVVATANADTTKTATATVTVLPPEVPVISVSVSPDTASVVTGATVNFTATVANATNTAVSWTVVESGGGSITTGGAYTAPANGGTFHVRATSQEDNTKTATATVTVRQVTVAIDQASPVVAPNQTIVLTATVSGTTNRSVNWSVVEADAGSITAGGAYTAPATSGTYTVRAVSVDDPRQSAEVSVTVQPLTVLITPNNPTIYVRESIVLTANVTGNPVTAVTWSATGGSITADGVYTAPATAGTYIVTATSQADPTQSDTVNITVDPAAIQVTPAFPSMTTLDTLQLSAAVFGLADTSVTWSVVGAPDAGTVSTSGMYYPPVTPSTPGVYEVQAVANGDATLVGTSFITVTSASGIVVSVSPTEASALYGQTVTFTATVTGTLTTTVNWTVVEAGGGSINASGEYVAPAQPGTYTIRATSTEDPSATATATVYVCGSIDTLVTYLDAATDGTVASGDDWTRTVTRFRYTADPVTTHSTYADLEGDYATIFGIVTVPFLETPLGAVTSAVDYANRGADGVWGTADDVVSGYRSVQYDANGNQIGYSTHATWGADQVWGTDDDDLSAMIRFAFDGNGYVAEVTSYSGAGMDLDWSTLFDNTIGGYLTITRTGADITGIVVKDGVGTTLETWGFVYGGAYDVEITVVNPAGKTSAKWQYTKDGLDRNATRIYRAYQVPGGPNPSTARPKGDRLVDYTYAGGVSLPTGAILQGDGNVDDDILTSADNTTPFYLTTQDACPL